VTDNVTELIWQQSDDDTQRTWADSQTYCENLALAGKNDWRLPTMKELSFILDLGMFTSAIHAVFTGTDPLKYWSSTAHADIADNMWYLEFDQGNVLNQSKSNSAYVRCIRGDASSNNFFDNDNETVTDDQTGLTWQKVDRANNTWESALIYCEGLSLAGKTDWRLPTFKELQSIVDYSAYAPAINTSYFPDTVATRHWTSSTNANNIGHAWLVSFHSGFVYFDVKTDSDYVRCVRGGR